MDYICKSRVFNRSSRHFLLLTCSLPWFLSQLTHSFQNQLQDRAVCPSSSYPNPNTDLLRYPHVLFWFLRIGRLSWRFSGVKKILKDHESCPKASLFQVIKLEAVTKKQNWKKLVALDFDYQPFVVHCPGLLHRNIRKHSLEKIKNVLIWKDVLIPRLAFSLAALS